MSDYILYQNVEDCIGCQACVLQCKTRQNLPVGPSLCHVMVEGPVLENGKAWAAYRFAPCFHCKNAPCQAACPANAIRTREDGIVYIDAASCDGCGACLPACPWGMTAWNPETAKAVKCDLCMDRLDQGLHPACVTICATGCLRFHRPGEVGDDVKKAHVKQNVLLKKSRRAS